MLASELYFDTLWIFHEFENKIQTKKNFLQVSRVYLQGEVVFSILSKFLRVQFSLSEWMWVRIYEMKMLELGGTLEKISWVRKLLNLTMIIIVNERP